MYLGEWINIPLGGDEAPPQFPPGMAVGLGLNP